MEKFHRTEKVSTADVRAGDCVFINERWRTLDRKDIRKGFTGTTICGDPLVLEGRKIERALFRKTFKGEVIGYYAQL